MHLDKLTHSYYYYKNVIIYKSILSLNTFDYNLNTLIVLNTTIAKNNLFQLRALN